MKITVSIDKRKQNGIAVKEYPIKLCFRNDGKDARISTGLFAAPDRWDNNRYFTDNTPQARRNNLYLTQELENAEAFYRDLQRKGKGNITPQRLKDLYCQKDKPQDNTFYDYFLEFIAQKVGRTKEIYQITYNKLKSEYPKKLNFEDVDYSFLKKFESQLVKRGNAINTIAIDMRNIRAVYNEAGRAKVVSKDLYPFDDYKITKEETRHRDLALEQLQALFDFQGTEAENYARDVAKLMFCLIGISATDLYDLSAPENDRIYYRRDKTGKLYSIQVQPEILPLFEQFKGAKHFLCFEEQYTSTHNFLKRINGCLLPSGKILKHGLHTIGNSLGIPDLTSYWLRHTWGTLAGKLDIPDKTIEMALGHGKKKTMDIYVKFDMKKVDVANRQVLDLVFNS